MTKQVKKYFVNHNMRTNLDSTHCMIQNALFDISNDNIKSFKFLGKVYTDDNYNELYDFKLELEELMFKAWYPVDGKTYGRIKAISDERNIIRYSICISKGMSEQDAALAFFE